VEDFEHYRADLDRFTQSFVKPKPGRTFLLAHSMGGAIALSALDSGSAGPYEKFVLNAPMLAMKTSPFPRWLARGLVDVLSGLGFGDSYAPTRGPRQALPEFQGAKGTSSPVRFALTRTLEIEQPGLFVGGPTNAWVRNALYASSTIARANRAPGKPLLFLVPTDDAFAEPGELLSLCRSGIPGCSTLELPGSKHEVFVERDEYRDRALRGIYEFLER
jgi:lysophospholipase